MSGRYRDSVSLDCKIYVGDLPSGASRQELEEAFRHYGYLKNVWVARNPPGFAFVEFEDPRDAKEAVRDLDGTSICGRRVRVEFSSGQSRRGGRFGRGPPPRRDIRDEKCYECGEKGHFARDCSYSRRRSGHRGRGHSRSRSRSRSYSPKRRYSRSRSRSPSRSRSRSRSRSNSGGVSPNRD